MHPALTTGLLFLLLSGSPLRAQTYAITDFGATTGGVLVTKAIQAAIDTCHRRGGGEVLVPAGTYLTGTLLLRSNVYLHLLPGSVLQGSYQPADYPEHDILKAKKYGTITHNGLYVSYLKALIIADGLENTGIRGEGTVKGAGEGLAFQLGENKDGKPLNILFIGCTNVLLRGIRVLNSAQVTISISGCDRVVVDGIYVKSLVNWNTDGLDVDGRDVTIANCLIDSEDDALCFKSEYLGRRCENITVTNCTVSSNCNGIKFGTGSRTGFRNITISNCIIKRPSTDNLRKWNILPGVVRDDKTTSVNTGIVILGVDGGVVENINISNIIMTDVISPFMIRVGRRFQTPDNKPSVMRNITIQHVMAESQSIIPSIIAGLADSPIDNIRFSDIRISIPIGVSADSLRTFPAVIPEQEKRYPENRMFGLKLPASGFYIRHARNIAFDNVDFQLLAPDSRPVYALDDVQRIRFTSKETAPYAVENEPGKQAYTPTKK